MERRSYGWLLAGLAVFGFAADQASKYGMFRWLYDGTERNGREVVRGAFKFLVQYDLAAPAGDCPLVAWSAPARPHVNRGALFGLGGEHEGTANLFFAGVSVLAALAIAFWGTRPDAPGTTGSCAWPWG